MVDTFFMACRVSRIHDPTSQMERIRTRRIIPNSISVTYECRVLFSYLHKWIRQGIPTNHRRVSLKRSPSF